MSFQRNTDLDERTVLDWFFRELADGPDTDALNYAAEALDVLLGAQPEGLRAALEPALRAPDNMAELRRHYGLRRHGRMDAYTLMVHAPATGGTPGERAPVQVKPRRILVQDREYIFASLAPQDPERTRHAERLRLAAAVGNMGLWDWDVMGKRLYLDDAYLAFLEYDRGEFGGGLDDWLDIIHPTDRPMVEAAIRRCIKDQDLLEVEHRVMRGNGGEAWVLSQGSALRDSDGRLVRMSGASLDITRRKQAEENLGLERKRFFSLLDRLPAYVVLVDRKYVVRFANRAATDLFGECVGRLCHEVHYGRSQPCEHCPPFDVFMTKSLTVWEWESEKLGRTFQVYDYPFEDADGTPLVLELGIDISRAKKALAALAESEERYRSIADNLALGIAVLDQNYRVTAVNPKIWEWFGAGGGDLCHKHYGFGLERPGRPDSCPGCPCRETMRDGQVHETLFEGADPDRDRSYRVTASPIFDKEGEVASVIEMVEDVTEQLRAQGRLQRARKIEALGTLAGGVAHEINQPLNALQLYASGLEMLLEKAGEVDRNTLMERLSLILGETGRIHEIIDRMRALVRQESLQAVGSAELDLVVERSMAHMIATLADHGIALDLRLEQGLPPVRTHAVQLEQVVHNLVVNAMHALDETDHPGKRIVVSTTLVEEADVRRVRLEVADNGPGVRGVEDKIFDPFFTTKEAGKGMGVGLSIVHILVDSWGGEVSVRNNEDGGASFIVLLDPYTE